MIDLYISWWKGDPRYHLYDDACNLFIDVTQLSSVFSFERTSRYVRPWYVDGELLLPNKLMLGGKDLEKIEDSTPKGLLNRQLELVKKTDGKSFEEAYFLSPDVTDDPRTTIEYAEAYYEAFERAQHDGHLPSTIEPMAVIHQDDAMGLPEVVNELIDIGYTNLALGAQEDISKLDRRTISNRLNSSFDSRIDHFHLLGVNSYDLFTEYPRLKKLVDSIDASTPIMEAKNSGMYFSSNDAPIDEIIRYKICSANMWEPERAEPWIERYGFAGFMCNPHLDCDYWCEDQTDADDRMVFEQEKLEEINKNPSTPRLDDLSCSCPVCQHFGMADGIFQLGKKIYNNRRAVHNVYHIKKELAELVDLNNPFVPRGNISEMP